VYNYNRLTDMNQLLRTIFASDLQALRTRLQHGPWCSYSQLMLHVLTEQNTTRQHDGKTQKHHVQDKP